jgi:hypothetical protein
MKHTIHVTQLDLDTKSYSDYENCPIAAALKREFPNSDVSVGGYSFYLDGVNYGFSNISPRLQEESTRISRGRAKPFWFRFTVKA